MERLTERYDADNRPDGESDVWVRNHDYVGASERLADYEDTGLTPQEIMELKERDTPKEAIYEIYGDQGDGADPDVWICPNCEAVYDIDDDYDFCPDCGQRLKK